ncbi:MFS transporter [Solimonas terrae]|uniref:MFS transporter n=1 Tax=Solimonas terrae TaxID=1396819 RepID=A0A6M2BPG0_9GAMM|nr:MFS transporter [Solimonas terrae]NGY03969.1 MFS transporter [Solimonas terrae]
MTQASGFGGLPTPRRYVAIVAVSLGTVLTIVDGAIVNVALPTLARDLHVEPASAVLVVTVYQFVLMAAMLPLSALSQRFGYRQTYQCGQALFVVATILCFFAHSLPFLVVVRGLQALGAAAAMSVSSALIRSIYPLSHLGRGLSLNTVIAASAAAFAPTVGGAILAIAAWPWLFAAIVPFGILSIAIGHRTLPDSIRQHAPFDLPGAALCAGTLGLIVIGLESGVHGRSMLLPAIIVPLGIAAGAYFVRRERRQAHPILPIDLLRQREIALPCLGSLSAYIAMTITTVIMPIRLQQEFGFSPVAAGAVLAPIPIVSVVVAPLSGLLSDRYPAGALGAIGMTIGFAGLASLAFLPAAPVAFDIAWRIAVCGLGFGMFFAPNSRQVLSAAPATRAAAAGAMYSTIRGTGQTLGATAVAAMLAQRLGAGPAPMLVASVLALAAGACSVQALRKPQGAA